MPIRCPYCSHEMALKGARPGRFFPRCAACSQKFALVIPDDPSITPTVAKAPNAMDDTVSPTIADALGIEQAPVKQPTARVMQTTVPTEPEPPPPERRARPQPAPYETQSLPDQRELRGRIGGYEIRGKLGQGGMGAVYLARQISLDRNVALKVLSPNLSQDPQFVARFTREAYAAAQLTHHNIVQIHDIGVERDVHYFSMEFVEGQTLAAAVQEHGKLDAEAAAGYVLQAARGLKFAHDHGMVHRDVKPENLLLNDQGIVKVADLGLVKRAGDDQTQITDVSVPAQAGAQTQLNVSMGTPAYMAPEQAQDAAHVDQRADIYSLGCTMYDLLTGRPPFMGRTALEVITKHAREPITPPDMVVRNVPKTLSSILVKMAAKRPEERYQSMGEVIRSLEDFLGVSPAGPFTPRQEHVKVLEFAVERFNTTGWAVLRWQVVSGFYVLSALATALLAWRGHPLWAAAIVGFAVLTTIAYQITIGITHKAYLPIRFRQLIFGSSIVDWLSWLAIGGLVVMLLMVFGWHWPWLGVSVVAVLAALGFHFSVDLMLNRERHTPLVQVEGMLRQMRLRGLDEMTIRQFVCKYGGRKWEEFFEALFGYEAKIQARQLWGKGERGRDRKKHAAWRDPVIRWIENKQAARREAREQKLLQKLEARALAAKGIADHIALKQARKNAQRVVDSAARLREQAAKRVAQTVAPTAAATKVETIIKVVTPEWVKAAAKGEADQIDDQDFEREHLSWFRRRFGTPLDFALGQQVRFVLAVLILAGFGLWWQQNKGQRALQQAVEVAARQREIDITGQTIDVRGTIRSIARDIKVAGQKAADIDDKPLNVPLVPKFITAPLSNWDAAVAGVILLVSVLFSGRLLGLTVLVAAAIALWGHHVSLPAIGVLPEWITRVAAAVVGLFGFMFLRKREGY